MRAAWLLLLLAGCPGPPAPVGPPSGEPATPVEHAPAPPAALTPAPAPRPRRASRLAPVASRPAESAGPSISEAQPLEFAANSARLSRQVTTLLDRLAPLLRQSTVRVEGHCDRAEQRAAVLSLERARAVQRYLVGKGVPAARLIVAGYAATRPAASGSSEEDRRQNRRVELVQGEEQEQQSEEQAEPGQD